MAATGPVRPARPRPGDRPGPPGTSSPPEHGRPVPPRPTQAPGHPGQPVGGGGVSRVVTRAAAWRMGASHVEKALAGRRVVRTGTTSRVGQAGYGAPGRLPIAKGWGAPARREVRDLVPGERPQGAEVTARRPAHRTRGRAPSRPRRGALADPYEPQATGRQPAPPPPNEVGAGRREPPDQAKLDGQRGRSGRHDATLNGRRGTLGRYHAAQNGR